MKLKMLVGMAGAGYSLSVNEETERFSGDEAKRLIEAGYAAPVAERETERATKKPAPERRDAPPPPADWDNPRSASQKKRG